MFCWSFKIFYLKVNKSCYSDYFFGDYFGSFSLEVRGWVFGLVLMMQLQDFQGFIYVILLCFLLDGKVKVELFFRQLCFYRECSN